MMSLALTTIFELAKNGSYETSSCSTSAKKRYQLLLIPLLYEDYYGPVLTSYLINTTFWE